MYAVLNDRPARLYVIVVFHWLSKNLASTLSMAVRGAQLPP